MNAADIFTASAVERGAFADLLEQLALSSRWCG
jgi:hypothetical protein